MAGIIDYLGKGVMPQFDMRGGGSSVPFADLSSQADATTAAGIDLRNQISDKFTSDSSAFSDGLDYLKDLMSPEDQEEDLLKDLVSSEPDLPIAPEEAADEGGFSFNDLFSPYTSVDEATGEITDQSTGEALLARGTTGLALTPALKKILIGGKGNPFVTAGLAIPEILRIGGGIIAPEATAALEEKIGAGYNEYIDPFVSPITGAISDKISEIEAAQDIEEQAFKEALLSQGADEESQYFDEAVSGGSMTADELEQYENMISDPIPSFDNYYADGGRVNLNTGGLTYGYTPFMDAQQGLDYYNQFAAPDYGITGIADQAEEAVEDAQEEATVMDETLGQTLQSGGAGRPGGGGYYDFQGGYKGFGGRDDITPDQTTMSFNDEGKLVYDGFASNIDQTKLFGGVQVGDEVPGLGPLFSGLNFLGGFFAKKDDVQDEIDAYNKKTAQEVLDKQKKDKEEREAQKQKEADAKAKADEEALAAKETYISEQYNNTGGGGNNFGPGGGPGTGTFAGGQVSGYTGQQSPHSSMSTGPKSDGKKDGPSTNNNKSNDGVGGGPGPKGGTGRPGDGNTRGKGCFVEGTEIQMADGSTKEITTIKVGEETKGGTVQATMEFMPQNIYNYKDVLVSGSHWVVEDNQFIAVEDSKHGVLTDRVEPVYTFKTSDNRIWIKDIEFGDFETGSDEDWEPHFEAVRQKLNKQLNEKRR